MPDISVVLNPTFVEVPLPGESSVAARAEAAAVRGEAAAVRAEAAVAGGNYTPPMAGGVTRPFVTVVSEISRSVADFGADMTGATDSSAALTAAMDWMRSVSAASNLFLPATTQRVLTIPAGRLYAPDYTLLLDRPGMTIRGDGINTTLDGISIVCSASRVHLEGMRVFDRRGPSAGLTGIKLAGLSRKECTLRELWGSGLNIFLELDDNTSTGFGFGVDNADTLYAELCNYGLVIRWNSGIHFSNCDFSNNFKRGVLLESNSPVPTGEAKFSNFRTLRPGTELIGCQMGAIRENYYSNFTSSVAPADLRSFPILNVTDNGAGKVRLTTGTQVAVTATSDATAPTTGRMVWGATGVAARQYISMFAAPASAIMSQINVAGVDLLAAPVVSAGDRPAFAIALVAAINARTGVTGYTARHGRDGLWELIAPLADGGAANGRLITITASGGLQWFTPRYTYISCPGHSYVADDDLWLLIGTVNGYLGGGIRGMAEVCWTDAGGFGIEFTWASTGTGIASTHNRLQPGLQEFAVRNNVALPTNPLIIAATPTTVDLEVPFTGQAVAGQATMPEWDLIINARNQSRFAQDQYFVGGNINCTLIKSAQNISFVGVRLKTQKWVDERANPILKSNKIAHIGPMSGQLVTPTFRPVRWGGATEGVADVGFFSEAEIPGAGYFGIQVPHKASGIVDGTIAEWNGFKALEIGALIEGSGASIALTSEDISFATPRGQALLVRDSIADAVNYVEVRSGAAGVAVTVAARGETDSALVLEANGSASISLRSSGGGRQAMVRHLASAVNYITLQGGAAGNGVTLGALGADADVDLRITGLGAGRINLLSATLTTGGTASAPGLAVGQVDAGLARITTNTVSIVTPTGEALRVQNGTGTTANYIEVRGGVAGFPSILAARGETNTALRIETNGTSQIDLAPGGIRQLQILRAASAVNFIFAQGGAAGTGPQIGVGGTDSSIDLRISAGGSTGCIVLEQAMQLRSYTVGTLPAASAYNSRTVRVSDRSNRYATSNGTIWQFPDGTTVS